MGLISFVTKTTGVIVLGGIALANGFYFYKIKPIQDTRQKFEMENDYFRVTFEPNGDGYAKIHLSLLSTNILIADMSGA